MWIRPKFSFAVIRAVSISSAEILKSLRMTGSKTYIHVDRLNSKQNSQVKPTSRDRATAEWRRRRRTWKKLSTEASSQRRRSRILSSWWSSKEEASSSAETPLITASSSSDAQAAELAVLLRFAAILRLKDPSHQDRVERKERKKENSEGDGLPLMDSV